jgi:serine/threonine protein kinase
MVREPVSAWPVGSADRGRGHPGFESGEFFVRAFESEEDRSWDAGFAAKLSPQESGEVYIGPLGFEECSEWDDLPGTAPGLAEKREDHWPRDAQLRRSTRRDHSRGTAEGKGLSRFQIVDVLGEGRHATVYRAFDPLLERQVALKVPRQEAAASVRALERFLGEARALARLRHPRIVPIYEAGRHGNRHYIAMALIEGCSLAEMMAQGLLPPRRVAEIAAELAEALAYAHGLGIIHRDVKPANIRLDNRGAVYLMDFGIAYRPDSGEIPTPPGTIVGTPAYLAPEQAKGGQVDVLPASDQYSLGAVLYELLCGQTPFFGPPSYVLFHAIHHDPPSPRTIAPKVPRTLAAICERALAKQPEWRYPSCQVLADDLRRWLHGETPLAQRRSLGWPRFIR